jgi:glycosyltransferase involved in cell wall biosynthesis
VLAVGRLVEKKGFSTLVAAAARLRGPVTVRIIGFGVEQRALERSIARHGVGQWVRLEGPTSHQHLADDYAWADLVAVPSVVDSNGDRDGLPNVALEAMACGRPLVVSDVSALGPTVRAAGSGLVVPSGDSEALAAALDTMRAPELRANLAVAGRRHVEDRYDLATCAGRFVEHLATLHVREVERADV